MLYGLWIFAFLLPFEADFLVPVELMMILGFLFSQKPQQIFARLRKQLFVLLSFALYAICLISALLFRDAGEEWSRQIMVKLPFLLVPLILIGSELSIKEVKTSLLAFAAGCLASGIGQLFLAFVDYLQNGNPRAFVHYSFSRFMHTTYLGMFQLFAAVYFFYLGMNSILKKYRYTYFFAALFCLLFVFLSGAKAIFLCLFFLAFYAIIRLIKQGKRSVWTWILPLSLLLAPIALYTFSSSFSYRINFALKEVKIFWNAEEFSEVYSTGTRILVWRNALDLFQDNAFDGVGIARVQEELDRTMKNSGDYNYLPRSMNAHSEFIQHGLAYGVGGLLLLIALLGIPLFYADKKNAMLIVTFLIVIWIPALTESIFERQAGTLFFTLVGSLLVLQSRPSRFNVYEENE